MNGRFHRAIVQACDNLALQAALALNDKLPFATAQAVVGTW
jgi:GntR family transcriptional regulator of vanillate catabolism